MPSTDLHADSERRLRVQRRRAARERHAEAVLPGRQQAHILHRACQTLLELCVAHALTSGRASRSTTWYNAHCQIHDQYHTAIS